MTDRATQGFSDPKIDYANLTVVNALGSARFYPDRAHEIMRGLVGATILNIGMPDEGDIEGGGLVIDYLKNGTAKRVILAFNDCGIWVEFNAETAIQGANP